MATVLGDGGRHVGRGLAVLGLGPEADAAHAWGADESWNHYWSGELNL